MFLVTKGVNWSIQRLLAFCWKQGPSSSPLYSSNQPQPNRLHTSRAFQTHLETFQLGHNICPHQVKVDNVATPFVVPTHSPGTCTLVVSLVHILGRQRQLAEFPAEGLCWSEHGDDAVGGAWPGVAVTGCIVWRRRVIETGTVVSRSVRTCSFKRQSVGELIFRQLNGWRLYTRFMRLKESSRSSIFFAEFWRPLPAGGYDRTPPSPPTIRVRLSISPPAQKKRFLSIDGLRISSALVSRGSTILPPDLF